MLAKKDQFQSNKLKIFAKMLKIKNELAGEVKSSEIGEVVMDKLREIDEVAYVRFASVYRKFADVEYFKKFINNL